MARDGNIFIGVGGWNFAPWRGTFYPKGLPQTQELHHASRQLTSTEINSTFYRLQTPATFQKWADDTPDGFVFSLKAPRFLTNRGDLAEAGKFMDKFFASGLARLGGKLGAINWQLAPTKAFDAKEIDAFLNLLPRRRDGLRFRHAIEVRHESFADNEEFVAIARDHEVAIVEAGDSEYPRIRARTAPFSYLRVMGTSAKSPKGYPPAALARWREHVESLAREGDVYLYFISGAKQRNPLAARALIESLGD